MTSVATPATTAMADAIVAATGFGGRLYPQNSVCNDAEQISEAVRRALDDGDELFPVDLSVGHTYVLIPSAGRATAVSPGVTQAEADALVRACAPDVAVCDACTGCLAAVASLLPVPAGAVVVVLALCSACHAFIADVFRSAHLIDPMET